MTTQEDLHRFVALNQRKQEIEGELKDLNRTLAALKADLMEAIPGWVVQPPYRVDGFTISLSKTTRAKLKGERHDGELALQRAGLENLLTYSFNLNTVSSWAREEINAGNEIPDEVLGQFDIIEDFDLRMTKG